MTEREDHPCLHRALTGPPSFHVELLPWVYIFISKHTHKYKCFAYNLSAKDEFKKERGGPLGRIDSVFFF